MLQENTVISKIVIIFVHPGFFHRKCATDLQLYLVSYLYGYAVSTFPLQGQGGIESITFISAVTHTWMSEVLYI